MSGTIARAHRGRIAALAAVLALVPPAVTGAELKPETVAAWNVYVQATEQRIDRELGAADRFLVLDFQTAKQAAEDRRRLDADELVLTSMKTRDAAGRDIDVPSGRIEHWRGAVFVRGVSLDQVMEALRSGATLEGQQDVLAARVLERNGDSMRTWLKLRRESIVTVTYDTEHAVTLGRLSPERAVSRSVSTRIVELENPGTAEERAKPEGRDSGYLWRLNWYLALRGAAGRGGPGGRVAHAQPRRAVARLAHRLANREPHRARLAAPHAHGLARPAARPAAPGPLTRAALSDGATTTRHVVRADGTQTCSWCSYVSTVERSAFVGVERFVVPLRGQPRGRDYSGGVTAATGFERPRMR